MITQRDQDIMLALEHIKCHPCGYMDDLDKFVSPNIISEFKSIGFLKIGQSGADSTYAITTFGRSYADVILQRTR